MDYTALIHEINTRHQNDYYKLILTHASVILDEIGRTSKHKVAEDLSQHPTKFSLTYKYLLAYDSINKDS